MADQISNSTSNNPTAQPEGIHQALSRFWGPSAEHFTKSTEGRYIKGDHYSVVFHVEPTPAGEKLVWATVHVPDPTNPQGATLVLSPFPDQNGAERLRELLTQAQKANTKADELLPQLESLGKESNGVGWISAVPIPFRTRHQLRPMFYLPPSLEMIINKDPLVGSQFMTSRNTNGRFEICTATIDAAKEEVSFNFYATDSSEPPRLTREIAIEIPGPLQARVRASAIPVVQHLTNLASEFQDYFHRGGMDFTIARLERFKVKFNEPNQLPPNASTDDHLRLLTELRPPYDHSHSYASGALLAVKGGTDVVSVMLKADEHAEVACRYTAILDRAKLSLSEEEWQDRRAQFVSAARLLGSESEGIQTQAIETIEALATQRATMPAPLRLIVGSAAAKTLDDITQTGRFLMHSSSGDTPSEVRRLCDGSEVLEFSRALEPLGQSSLATFHELVLEFKVTGDVAFTATNLLGNTVAGEISDRSNPDGTNYADSAVLLYQLFVAQSHAENPIGFRNAIEKFVAKAATIDGHQSYCLSHGFSPHLDLPSSADIEGTRAFSIAAELAQLACATSEGHGKHKAGAIQQGTAEARLQFSGAPYDLAIRVTDRSITQATFIPKQVADGASLASYTFSGELRLSEGGATQIETLIIDFARWGKEHCQKKPNARPLEEIAMFSALKKIFPD